MKLRLILPMTYLFIATLTYALSVVPSDPEHKFTLAAFIVTLPAGIVVWLFALIQAHAGNYSAQDQAFFFSVLINVILFYLLARLIEKRKK